MLNILCHAGNSFSLNASLGASLNVSSCGLRPPSSRPTCCRASLGGQTSSSRLLLPFAFSTLLGDVGKGSFANELQTCIWTTPVTQIPRVHAQRVRQKAAICAGEGKKTINVAALPPSAMTNLGPTHTGPDRVWPDRVGLIGPSPKSNLDLISSSNLSSISFISFCLSSSSFFHRSVCLMLCSICGSFFFLFPCFVVTLCLFLHFSFFFVSFFCLSFSWTAPPPDRPHFRVLSLLPRPTFHFFALSRGKAR